MQKSKTQSLLEEEVGDLYISCFDSIQVTDRTTFDSYMFNDLQVTFWMEDEKAEERVNKMFDLFFQELKKTGNKTILSILE